MELHYYWERFIQKFKGKPGARYNFENLMLELLKAENPDKEVHRVDASRGDGGIDILVQQDNGIDIYQCKFFTDELGYSQRDQIRKSFKTAMEDKGVKVLRWFLCMPLEQDPREISWVHNFIKKRSGNYGVEIHFIYGTEIINRIEKNDPSLIDKYFSIPGHKHFTNKALIVPFTKEDSYSEQGGTYIPRDDLLSKIADSFQSQSGKKRMVFLSGMGGCGKSELARAYAESHSSTYEEIFWLTCTDGIEPDLMMLMSDADTLCDVKKEDLVAFSDKVLIIVDNCNCNDARFLHELERGTGLADILVSTRLEKVGSYTYIIPIDIEYEGTKSFAYSVFEKNYCRKQPWQNPKEIKDSEICFVHDICREVQYNTMIIALIGLRLCQYDTLSISDCAQKIKNGISTLKGTIDYSKDLYHRSEEMKDVLRFLFKDILNYPTTEAQKEVLSVLSLTPASWYEMDYIYSLTGDGIENNEHEYAAKKLLSLGWLQGSDANIAIHPLIAEVIQPLRISNPAFFCNLLNNYLGLQEKHLFKNRFLINKIIIFADGSLPEAKLIAMLLSNHGGYKKIFANEFPNVSSAYFVYETHGSNRYFYYQDIEKQETHPIISCHCQTKEEDSVKLINLYSKSIPYVLDLSITINNKAITRIPAGICYEDSSISNCIFSQHLTVIEEHAFHGCANLSGELQLPDSLSSIGIGAFYQCTNLSGELHLPNNLTTIGISAFEGCASLTGKLCLPNSLNKIEAKAFFGCSGLSGELRLPDDLTSIGISAFEGCSGLSGELHFPDHLTIISDAAFYRCSGLSGNLRLPDNLTKIGDGAFYECIGLSGDLYLPETLTSLGEWAFYGCSGFLGRLHLPSTLTRIGRGVFYNCSGLSGNLQLPDNLTSIGYSAFKGCISLSGGLNLPDSLNAIGNFAFYGCSNLSGELHLPEVLISIGENSFFGCSGLSGKLQLPDALSNIGEMAFYGCSGLSGDIQLPNSLTVVGDLVFYGCSGLSGNLHLPHNLTSIGNHAFYGCSGLSGNLQLPNSLTHIGAYAFYGCSGLSGKLQLPHNLTSIGNHAFYGCSGLSGGLPLPNNLTRIGFKAFDECDITSIENRGHNGYSNVSNNWHFSGELHIPDALTRIEDRAFYECTGLSGSPHLPDNLTSIGDWAFYRCTALSGNLQLPNSLTNIGAYAFYGCTGLSGELWLPNSLTSIGEYAFYKCTGLSGNLHLPDALTSIGDWAFSGCTGISGELWLPNNLTSIGKYAFYECTGLSGSLHLPDSLTRIGDGAFQGCGLTYIENKVRERHSNLTRNKPFLGKQHISDNLSHIEDGAFCECTEFSGNLHLPDTLVRIGNFAFYRCSNLNGNLRLPDQLTSIGSYAFAKCTGLSGRLRLPDSLTSIGKGAFSGCSGLSGKLFLPESLTSIGDWAFDGCSGLSGELHLPKSLNNIGNMSFNACTSIEKIVFYNPKTQITGLLIPFSSTLICGYRHSTAEEYALRNGLVFEELKPGKQ